MGEEDRVLYSHPAALVKRATSAELLAICKNSRAFDPTIFDEVTPVFFAAEISSNRLDAYFTRMSPSSLRNYASEAAEGVSFQDSHNTDRLGIGYSLTGTYEELATDALARVMADFYTIPGLPDSDPFIRRMRAGIARDVSIGFYGGQFRCSICGRDMFRDWNCWHIPGVQYDKRNELGDIVGQELALAWVENAHLAEVSAVYDGATPGAAILKAQQEADGGRLRPETARMLEQRYRGLKFAGTREIHAGASLPGTHQEARMPGAETTSVTTPAVTAAADTAAAGERTEETQPAPEGTVVPAAPEQEPVEGERTQELVALPAAETAEWLRINTRLTELGAPDGDISARMTWMLSQVEEAATLRAAVADTRATVQAAVGDRKEFEGLELGEVCRRLASENSGLRSLAEVGRQYRTNLVEEVLREGVRARGKDFAPEVYRGMLETAPVETILRMRDDFAALAALRFPGGRQTVEMDAGKKTPAAAPADGQALPDYAYTS